MEELIYITIGQHILYITARHFQIYRKLVAFTVFFFILGYREKGDGKLIFFLLSNYLRLKFHLSYLGQFRERVGSVLAYWPSIKKFWA